MKIYLHIIISIILLIGNVFALTCTPDNILKEIVVGETPSTEIITCTNNNNYSINFIKSPENFFYTNPSDITINNNSQDTFQILFNQIDEPGEYNGYLFSTDGSLINIKVNAIEQENEEPEVIVFPTSKIINIKQGEEKSQNIQIIVPANYPSKIKIESVSFNPDIDVVRFGDLNLGLLNPGATLNIPIVVDAKNVQTGTYITDISILATDSNGQVNLPKVHLQIIVSIGTTPVTNATFTQRPDCTLSSLELNLNNTFTFSCTNIVENLVVMPQYNEFLEGVKAEYGVGTYTYSFKAKKIGTTEFLALFTYRGSPIFEPFRKEIRITPSGSSSIGGTNLTVEFYQSGIKKSINDLESGETVILILDAKTKNIIDMTKAKIFLNGLITNSTFNLESEKVYELRISATELGYEDLVLNFSVKKKPIKITIKPSKVEYLVGEEINLSAEPEDATFLIGDVIIDNHHKLKRSGNITIVAKREGYEDSNITISVIENIQFVSSPLEDEIKKGNELYFELNNEADWEVLYKKNKDSETKTILNGTGKIINFRLSKSGIYWINANGKLLWSHEVKGFWDSLFGSIKLWHFIVFGVILISLIYLFFRGEKGKEEGLVFMPKPKEGE